VSKVSLTFVPFDTFLDNSFNGLHSHSEVLLCSISRRGFEHFFDTRSALWASVQRDQTLEDRGKVTIDTRAQREIILAEDFPLCGKRNVLLRSRAEPV